MMVEGETMNDEGGGDERSDKKTDVAFLNTIPKTRLSSSS